MIKFYINYLRNHSLGMHSLPISMIGVFGFLFSFILLPPLANFETERLSIKYLVCSVVFGLIWLTPTAFVGISLRVMGITKKESVSVKIAQYSFTALALLATVACWDVLNNKRIYSLLIVFEIPALIIISTYIGLAVLAKCKISRFNYFSFLLSFAGVISCIFKINMDVGP